MEEKKLNELLKDACERKDLQLFKELVGTHCDSNYIIKIHSSWKNRDDEYFHSITETPLIVLATENGFIQGVDFLFDNDVNIDASSASLHIAARKGYIEIVKKLIKHGAKISFNAYESVIEAAENGHPEILLFLIGFLDSNLDSNIGKTKVELITYALERSIWTYAYRWDLSEDISEYEIKEEEFLKVVSILLSSGAELTLTGVSEIIQQPKLNRLFFYLKDKHIQIQTFLNLNKKELIQSAANNLAIIEYFNSNYGEIILDDNEVYSLLREAIKVNNVAVVEIILKQYNKVDINKFPSREKSLLSLAATEGHIELVELLIQFGTNLNEFDGFDMTPIIQISDLIFIEDVHFKIIDILIRHGANINLRMPYSSGKNSGATALKIAKRHYNALADFLISRGGKVFSPKTTLYELLADLNDNSFSDYLDYILREMNLESLIKLEKLMLNKNDPSYINYTSSIKFDFSNGILQLPFPEEYDKNLVTLYRIMKENGLVNFPPLPNWIGLKLNSLISHTPESNSFLRHVGFDLKQGVWVWSNLDKSIRSLQKDN